MNKEDVDDNFSDTTSVTSESSANFGKQYLGGGYSSDFEDVGPLRYKQVNKSHKNESMPPPPPKRKYSTMNAYQRHCKFMNDYLLYYGGKDKIKQEVEQRRRELLRNFKSDKQILREEYRFIRTEEDDEEDTWEKRLAKKYYDKLFKEYCLADLSRYKEKKIGLRWRVEKEVISGKGQFSCGALKCDEKEGLQTFEVNFAYKEVGEHKNALVKLRLCPNCTKKMEKIYGKKKRKREQQEEEEKNKKQKLEADKKDSNVKKEEEDYFQGMFP